ncbi:endonuclease domain-containing protein [Phenylobacterium sp.]|uniref:endonuclease domain-containing protein n=1 Tax=Phenylobacterium sp. TaxID=1871053 RepID=UPI002732D2FF|nr:endonuclease domain-containing protein [Phenylobacterium sp.]MDP3855428.1 endonuclease domain-containing protein [Phenylobacterium sp.]
MRSSVLTLIRAKVLRRTMTEPEVMLWSRLRRRGPDAPVFRRQHPMGAYILDFFCPSAKLAVEIDGHRHGEDAQRAHDEHRDRWLVSLGITVHRITASWVYEDVKEVADALRNLATQLSGRRS